MTALRHMSMPPCTIRSNENGKEDAENGSGQEMAHNLIGGNPVW